MALNFDFNSLNFGGNDQVSNPMMRPVNLSQLDFNPSPSSFGTPDPFQPPARSPEPQSRIIDIADTAANIGKGVLDLLQRGAGVLRTPSQARDQLMYSGYDYMTNPSQPSFGESYDMAQEKIPFELTYGDIQDAINAGMQNAITEDMQNEFDTQQEYCEAKYGDGTTLERCAFLDEEEARSLNEDELNNRDYLFKTEPTAQDFEEAELAAEASFVLPNGEVRTIMPGQDVASAFGRERGTSTFNVDEGSVTVPSELLAETMGLTPSLQDIQNVQPPQVAPDDRSSFLAESAAREQRLRDRDRQPGETPAERDTRTAKSRQQQRSSSDMSFDQARKFVTRREYSNGKKESVSSFNDRIRAFKELYNSDNSKIEREAERLANEGRRINNERVQAVIDNYKKTESEKYNDVLNVGQKMLADGILKTEQELVLFIVDRMKGDISEIFDPFIDIGGGDNNKDVTNNVLNVPVEVNSQEEYDNLQVGQRYVDSSGTTKTKR